jgi:GAF domain-containing protein
MKDTTTCLNLMRQTAHALAEDPGESEVIRTSLVQIVAALQAQGGLLYLLSPDGDRLLPAQAVGRGEPDLAKGPRIAQSALDQRVLAGETVVIPASGGESAPLAPGAAAESAGDMVCTPLQVRGHAMGLVQIYVQDADELSQEAVLLANILADLGAVALEKGRLQQSLYRIAEALNASLELKQILQHVLEATVREMWLKAASIRLLDARRQTLTLVASYGLGKAYVEKGTVHVAKSPVDQHVLDGEVVVLYDVEHETGFEYPAEAVHEGIRSVLAVPLKLQEQSLGVMRVYSARPRHFGPVAVRFLTSAAGLVALAIENAELHAALQARCEDMRLDLAEWYRFLALG